jgi:hypothetical protein
MTQRPTRKPARIRPIELDDLRPVAGGKSDIQLKADVISEPAGPDNIVH